MNFKTSLARSLITCILYLFKTLTHTHTHIAFALCTSLERHIQRNLSPRSAPHLAILLSPLSVIPFLFIANSHREHYKYLISQKYHKEDKVKQCYRFSAGYVPFVSVALHLFWVAFKAIFKTPQGSLKAFYTLLPPYYNRLFQSPTK